MPADGAPGGVVLVGSYAAAADPGIHVFTMDGGTGELRPERAYPGVPHPSFLAVHPEGAYLYAVGETGLRSDGHHGSVHAFRIIRDDGAVRLVPLNRRTTGGDHPCHLALDGGGRRLAVSNYGTGDVAVFAIEPDGALGPMTSSARHAGAGPHADRQERPHAHSALFAPGDRFLLVADLGIDRIVVYRIDPVDASLIRHDEAATRPGAGPRHMAFHPDGRHLLVVNELDNTLTLFGYDPQGGGLEERQTLPTVPDQAEPSTAADVHIAASGAHVYVSNRGHDSVAVYRFDPERGLSRLAITSCGGRRPRSFALSPDGRWMAVANRATDEVAVMPLRGGGAELGEPVARARVAQPSFVTFT
jgi:6-phosphogluconolactonase